MIPMSSNDRIILNSVLSYDPKKINDLCKMLQIDIPISIEFDEVAEDTTIEVMGARACGSLDGDICNSVVVKLSYELVAQMLMMCKDSDSNTFIIRSLFLHNMTDNRIAVSVSYKTLKKKIKNI